MSSAIPPLLRLPPELLHYIANGFDLPSAAILAWRATCHEARSVLADPSHPTMYDRLLFIRQLHSDRQIRFEQLAKIGEELYRTPILKDLANLQHEFTDLTHLLCSGCLMQHPIGSFSPTQRQQPAIKRTCRGLEGRLWLCKHHSLSHEDIRRAARPFPWIAKTPRSTNLASLECMRGKQPCEECAADEGCSPPFEECLKSGNNQAVCLESSVGILKRDGPLGFMYNNLYRQVAASRLKLCPHWATEPMRTAVLASCMLATLRPYHKTPHEVASFSCHKDGCDTKIQVLEAFKLKTWHQSAQAAFEIKVVRNLGCMDDLEDQKWLAQICASPPIQRSESSSDIVWESYVMWEAITWHGANVCRTAYQRMRYKWNSYRMWWMFLQLSRARENSGHSNGEDDVRGETIEVAKELQQE